MELDNWKSNGKTKKQKPYVLKRIGSYPKSVDSVLSVYGGKEYQKRCILRQDWKSGSNGRWEW